MSVAGLGLLLAGLAAAARAAETSPVNALNKVESTRAQAFGGAAVALGNDPTFVWVNPAATAQVAGSSLTVGAQRGYFEDVTGQALFTSRLAGGALTAGLLYYDAGAGTGVYQTDGDAWTNPLQQDVMAAAGWARTLSSRVAAGALLKTLHTRLDDDAKAWGAVLDAGAHLRVRDAIKVGVSVQNLGTRVRYMADPVSPPAAARVGVALGWRLTNPEAGPAAPADSVILALDGEQRFVDGDRVLHAGAEYQWHGKVAVRAGMRLSSLREPAAISAGAGLKLGGVRFDYSIRYNEEFAYPQTLSLTFDIPPRGAKPAAPPPEEGALEGSEEGVTQTPGAGAPALPDAQTKDAAGLKPPPDKTTTDEQPAEETPPDRDLIDDLNRQLDETLKQKKRP